jgi:hypothetical protein
MESDPAQIISLNPSEKELPQPPLQIFEEAGLIGYLEEAPDLSVKFSHLRQD